MSRFKVFVRANLSEISITRAFSVSLSNGATAAVTTSGDVQSCENEKKKKREIYIYIRTQTRVCVRYLREIRRKAHKLTKQKRKDL